MGERVTQPLAVLQLLPALNSGGVERGTLEIAAELVRQGHRSMVISAGGRMVPELLAAGAEHTDWPIGRKSPLTLRLVPRLRQLLLKERIDILHARSRLPAWIAWLAWRGMDPGRRPCFITTVHGLYSVNAYSAVMLKGERIIAVSDTAREYALRNFQGVQSERIQVIHRGVDPAVYPSHFRPDASWQADWYRQYPSLRERFVITLAGRVSRRKGVFEFISVIAALQERGIDAHGLIVGELPARKGKLRSLKSTIAAAGVGDMITCTGFRNDMREIMSVSDAVVSLSLHPESFGRTVNEALSLGIPVAGYAHGGVGEQLARHFPAGAVAPGDDATLVELLASWQKIPPSMQDIRVHTLQDMLDATLDLYKQCQPQ
jgi:glycosyltransferase involved in cell wall biosynthesis